MDFFQDKTVQTILIIVVVVVVIYFLFIRRNTESFGSIPIAIERVEADEQIIIPPQYIQPDGTIMGGPDLLLPNEIIPAWGSRYGIADTIFSNDLTGENAIDYTLSNPICSKSCCSDQYSTPFAIPEDPLICNNRNNFVPNNMYCNNSWQDAGCLCMTREEANMIHTRGNNK